MCNDILHGNSKLSEQVQGLDMDRFCISIHLHMCACHAVLACRDLRPYGHSISVPAVPTCGQSPAVQLMKELQALQRDTDIASTS